MSAPGRDAVLRAWREVQAVADAMAVTDIGPDFPYVACDVDGDVYVSREEGVLPDWRGAPGDAVAFAAALLRAACESLTREEVMP